MRIKILFYGAIGFFILGYKCQDSLIYFFFSVYFFSLWICFFCYMRENRPIKSKSELVEETETD